MDEATKLLRELVEAMNEGPMDAVYWEKLAKVSDVARAYLSREAPATQVPQEPTEERIMDLARAYAACADAIRALAKPSVPYPQHCLHPDKCAGLGSCPREICCAD